MQGDVVVEDRGWPVVRVVVRHAAGTARRIVERFGEFAQLTGIFVILPAYGQAQMPSGRNDNTGRNDLDVTLVNLAGRQRLDPVVRVKRTVWRGLRV